MQLISLFLRRRLRLIGTVASLSLFASACSESPSPLQPRGFDADIIANLLWLLMAVGTVAAVVAIGFMGYALWRAHRREDLPGDDDPKTDVVDEPPPIQDSEAGLGTRFVFFAGGVIPALVLVATFGVSVWTLMQTNPDANEDLLTIEVIGHQWWWEVHYPEQGFETANEIHVPVGQPVEILLVSADVIHSFWVPQIHGIRDLNPGDINRIVFEADEAGVYRGECTEYCGIQHAKMFFMVVAEPQEAFEEWLVQQQQIPPEPDEPLAVAGKELFFEKACDECHRIAGTAAEGDLGPDLTHFASRLTIGAGILENNRGNLAGWIIDPQSIKLGALMPLTDYSGPELQALLAYMETLE